MPPPSSTKGAPQPQPGATPQESAARGARQPCKGVSTTRLRRSFSLAAALLLLAALAIALVPLPSALDLPTPATLTLLDRQGTLLTQLPSSTARVQTPIPLSEMGPWLPRITVALEDRRFYRHHGVDMRGTVASAWRDLRARRIVAGGSTITQQLIKLASDRTGRSWRAKLYETVAAWKLERRWSKGRILTEYLNRSAYGNRLVGPEAAARWYFGKGARDLALSEAVFLAGLPQSPTRYNPLTHPAAAEARYQRSLRTLAAQGLTLPEGASPRAGRHLPPRLAPHFTAALRQRFPALTGTVRTSLDLPLQERAEALVRSHLRELHRTDVTCAAVVILDHASGGIRAMVGSPDFTTAEVNETTAAHSAGSTLKPFLYLHALEARTLTAATVLPDTAEAIRDAYADYDPQDYTRQYLGPVRVREALACSLNIPAVVALSRTGARAVFFDLRRWGFALPRGLDDYGAGFILGNAEVRPLDLAAAYAGLARGGVSVRPAFLESTRYPGQRIASREAATIITDILCDNDARARGFGTHSPLALSQRAAAKTGTSSGFRDAWTVGFTRDHTVAVWVGNASGHPMREALSVRAAAPLWAALMEGLLREDAPVEKPALGERLVSARVGPLTGLRSPDGLPEWFLPGTEPREDEAASFAPDTTGRPRLLLPAEYAAWCASRYNSLGALCPAAKHLAIVQPAPQSRFALDSALPLSQQKLELACTGAIGRAVRWYVNETEISAGPGGRTFWPLATGDWRIRAVCENQSAEVAISVE